jgi:hypothetical protein
MERRKMSPSQYVTISVSFPLFPLCGDGDETGPFAEKLLQAIGDIL